MASQLIILYDACVLYPAPLRDLLVQIATSDICKARWTNLIHDEWIRNVLKNRPDLTLEQLTRTRDKMNRHVRGCLVTDFEWLVPSLELPDLDDRHILAAAIACEATQIVTFNLRDFPKAILENYKILALHPDEFVTNLIKLKPIAMLHQVETVRKRLLYPPKNFDEYLEILLKQGLPLSVSMLKELQNTQNII